MMGRVLVDDEVVQTCCPAATAGVAKYHFMGMPKHTYYNQTGGIKMDFGKALEALKAGKRVARKGWNGKGMFLWLKPATEIKSDWCKDPMLKDLVDANGGSLQALGTICMYTTDSTGRKAILTGWLASQSDMLLEDWEILND
jgi:hypothetical protein